MIPDFRQQASLSPILDYLLVADPKKRPSANQARRYLETRIGRDRDWTQRKRVWGYSKSKSNLMTDDAIFALQTGVNPTMRYTLVEWIFEVGNEFKLRRETRILAVGILDDYLRRKLVKCSRFQLVGVMALCIASKFEEELSPVMKDYVYICDYIYTIDECLEMERDLCETLSFRIDTSWL